MSLRLGCGALSWAEKRRGGLASRGRGERGQGDRQAPMGPIAGRAVGRERPARGLGLEAIGTKSLEQPSIWSLPPPSAALLTPRMAFSQLWDGTWYFEAYVAQGQDEG